MTRVDFCPHCLRRLPKPRDGFWRALEAQAYLCLHGALYLALAVGMVLQVGAAP